jgi:hypothetical protein
VCLLLHLGAAEATAGMDDVETVTALSRFCADAGSGRPWREAFRQHLGRDVEQVHAAVEQRRRSERCPRGRPRTPRDTLVGAQGVPRRSEGCEREPQAHG